MSAEKLAFLQNFYTDVTLYVPVEPGPSPVAVHADVTPKADGFSTERPATAPQQPAAPEAATLNRLAPAPPSSATVPERLVEAVKQPAEAVAASPAPAPRRSDEPPPAPAVAPVMLTQFATLGSNEQGVVLLFRLPSAQFLKLHRNVFLNKMLQALGLVMADVVLVNVESELPVALANLRRELAATHIVAFGKNLLDVTIRNTQIYEPVLFPSLGLSYLASATVDLVEYDPSLKKRLWPGLQAMFLS